ncbi:MAG: molybdenum cofactor guanylyltransferase [Chloroflexi bacterium]|nr:molybdenum cofactor guanylyltransferase [Chloroflexota bacterium]
MALCYPQVITKPVVTSIIVAGGKGARFGRDKLSELIGGRTLIQRVLDRVRQLSDETVVTIAHGRPQPVLSPPPSHVAVDVYPNRGALGGIYTGLCVSRSEHALVVAADMPFLNNDLLRYMIERAPGFDVVIPRIGGNIEPLHAVYSRDCLQPMKEQLEHAKLRISDLLGRVRVRYVAEKETARFDPEHLSFFNINTTADLQRARGLIEERGDPEI